MLQKYQSILWNVKTNIETIFFGKIFKACKLVQIKMHFRSSVFILLGLF